LLKETSKLSNCELLSFGRNDDGQLCTGDKREVISPFKVTFFLEKNIEIKKITCGCDPGGGYSLFVTSKKKLKKKKNLIFNHKDNGQLFGTGFNYYGELGNGFSDIAPKIVLNSFFDPTTRYVADISTSLYKTVVLTKQGELYIFGRNISKDNFPFMLNKKIENFKLPFNFNNESEI
jgi:alpha-tubulin suppressor-like RCC1 family protein